VQRWRKRQRQKAVKASYRRYSSSHEITASFSHFLSKHISLPGERCFFFFSTEPPTPFIYFNLFIFKNYFVGKGGERERERAKSGVSTSFFFNDITIYTADKNNRAKRETLLEIGASRNNLSPECRCLSTKGRKGGKGGWLSGRAGRMNGMRRVLVEELGDMLGVNIALPLGESLAVEFSLGPERERERSG